MNEARQMARQAEWGRIHVMRIPVELGTYLARYLAKERPECFKHWRLWAGFGEWDWTRVKDVVFESAFSSIYRACKEWLGGIGKKGFFDRMRLVALCCKEELGGNFAFEAPF